MVKSPGGLWQQLRRINAGNLKRGGAPDLMADFFGYRGAGSILFPKKGGAAWSGETYERG